MVTAKHTPGPWRAEFACHVNEHVTDVGQGAFQILSADKNRAGWVLCSRHRWPEHEQEMNANARLVAAAPDLLEALQDCRRALLNAGATGELEFVDAAIKKATGGTP